MIADAKTKVYGDADPSLTYQVSGLKNGDTAGAVLNGGGLVRVSGENQGDLALNSGNYDLSYQGNNLTITKALLNVIADAKTKVYGDADPSLTYQVSVGGCGRVRRLRMVQGPYRSRLWLSVPPAERRNGPDPADQEPQHQGRHHWLAPTPVTAVKGRCPRPLDEGDNETFEK